MNIIIFNNIINDEIVDINIIILKFVGVFGVGFGVGFLLFICVFYVCFIFLV